MQKLNWREKYAATLVLLIGIIMLLMQVITVISAKSSTFSLQSGSISIDKKGFFADIRTYVFILMGLLGGVLLFAKKLFGWVLSVPLLSLFAILTIGGVIEALQSKTYGTTFILIISGLVLLLLAITFLFMPTTRQKYRVGKYTYLPTLILLMALVAIYFFLQ